jgi:hypothetical protein
MVEVQLVPVSAAELEHIEGAVLTLLAVVQLSGNEVIEAQMETLKRVFQRLTYGGPGRPYSVLAPIEQGLKVEPLSRRTGG